MIVILIIIMYCGKEFEDNVGNNVMSSQREGGGCIKHSFSRVRTKWMSPGLILQHITPVFIVSDSAFLLEEDFFRFT